MTESPDASRQPPRGDQPATNFSFIRLVFNSLGSGALVLFISIPFILWGANHSPYLGLGLALLAIVLMIATIGLVSRRMVDRARSDILAAREAEAAAAAGRPEPRRDAEAVAQRRDRLRRAMRPGPGTTSTETTSPETSRPETPDQPGS